MPVREIGRLVIGTERPDLLSNADRTAHERALAERALGIDADAPWLTLPKALHEITEMLNAATQEEAELLHGHHQYLVEAAEQAMSYLGAGVPGKDADDVREDILVTA